MHTTKTYPNVVYLAVLVSLTSIVFSLFTPAGLEKAAFLFATTIGTGLITIASVFAKRGSGGLFSLNVALLATGAVLTLVAVVVGMDTTVFTDSVAEGVQAAVAGGLLGLMSTYASADHNES